MIELSPSVALPLNIVVWFGWSLMIGYLGHRRSSSAFAADRWWSALRPFENRRAWYARTLRINSWKDVLPEAGALFTGGFAKRHVRRDSAHLERFIVETRRAEWVHWMIFLVWPVFSFWNPPWAMGVMFLYATAANVPCILVQRHNRGRLMRLKKRFVYITDAQTPAEKVKALVGGTLIDGYGGRDKLRA
jgi:glycosyl-4,4'-diaponeurosporenoate acyltransferase